MGSVEIHVDTHGDRFNDSAAALGRMRRARCCGIMCIWSPDALVYFVPTVITMVLVFGVLFTLWAEIEFYELCVLAALLLTAFTSSFLVICTDPGVYPRLRSGEVDPLSDKKELVYCRVCGLRRPLRTSHCYQCNVCVREHDHHCGIIGGCVGQRSLRWFALYLVTVSTSASIGLYWLLRSLYTGAFAHQGKQTSAVKSYSSHNNSHVANFRSHGDDAARALAIVGLLIVLLLVVMLVGGLAVFYMYLLLTSTTRRESQRMQTRLAVLMRPMLMWDNLKHIMFPPPSMLCTSPGRTATNLF